MGELVPFRKSRRRRRPALPPQWARHVRRRPFSAGQLRLTLWSGLLLGLLLFKAMRFWPAPLDPAAGADELPAFVDPYADSRRYREQLNAQEGPPPSALPQSGGSPIRGSSGLRVIDGDTFDYAGARIRIADIDTPEVNGRCPEETALAAHATRRLERLLAQRDFELHPPPGGARRGPLREEAAHRHAGREVGRGRAGCGGTGPDVDGAAGALVRVIRQ